MTFWQENYGFVKEVYDFRCSKYLEWMDNIEAIIGKVMANTQYTAKEFKIIKDTFTVRTTNPPGVIIIFNVDSQCHFHCRYPRIFSL
ncbi:hypothetical protein Pmani_003315 [Petrolisthes manimaculis]|uniref:Uncharacterized protein n=1 Tax=Petrolisthes manimaculis TaxID=1843537 RepID=A0AAE1QJ51_9EUCA|nr:hypothetical protein Pmani_003315 [Petrolisthes manimaculis]